MSKEKFVVEVTRLDVYTARCLLAGCAADIIQQLEYATDAPGTAKEPLRPISNPVVGEQAWADFQIRLREYQDIYAAAEEQGVLTTADTGGPADRQCVKNVLLAGSLANVR